MSYLLFMFSVATVALFLGLSGCATGRLDTSGPYRGNATLYATDASIDAAFRVLDVFMSFQMQQRANLPADVNAFADKTRRDAPLWAKRIIALRDAYAANPTPDGKANLDTVLALLRAAVVQASAYLVEKPASP